MILITGATGFLGAELTRQLLPRYPGVRCLKRAGSVIPSSLSGLKIEWAEADILDHFAMESAFEGITHVYHCAAFISFQGSDKQLMRNINAQGTGNIVNLCLQKNIRKLVHVSSVAAIGEARPADTITEDDHWEFTGQEGGYAISKYEAEMEVWRGIAEGLNAVIVNPSVIIGKGAGKKGSGQLFQAVRNGLDYYTPGSLGIVDVEDVAAAMILLMEATISGERFILNAESLSNLELFSLIAEGYGLKPPSKKLGAVGISFAWRGAALLSAITGRSFALTRDTAKSSQQKHDYSNNKFCRAFPDFHFKPVAESIYDICSGSTPTH